MDWVYVEINILLLRKEIGDGGLGFIAVLWEVFLQTLINSTWHHLAPAMKNLYIQ